MDDKLRELQKLIETTDIEELWSFIDHKAAYLVFLKSELDNGSITLRDWCGFLEL